LSIDQINEVYKCESDGIAAFLQSIWDIFQLHSLAKRLPGCKFVLVLPVHDTELLRERVFKMLPRFLSPRVIAIPFHVAAEAPILVVGGVVRVVIEAIGEVLGKEVVQRGTLEATRHDIVALTMGSTPGVSDGSSGMLELAAISKATSTSVSKLMTD